MEQIENRVAIEQENDAEEVMNSTASSDAREALEHGPHRATVLAGLAVVLLFIGRLLFYFILFMRRGYVG